MTEQQVLVKGLKVNYKVFGDGSPMVILHGWSSSSDRWQKTAELLSAKHLRIIVPDLPGFGKSQEPATAWSLDGYVEWLDEFSEKIPELHRNFLLLGHSFGGAVAAKFVIKYNQKVEKLFLVAAACVRKRTAIKKMWYRFSKLIKLFAFLPYYHLLRRAFYKFVLKKSDYPYVSGVMKETYLQVILDDLSHKLSYIKTPTVLIWGDKDDSTPIAQAQFISRKIRNAVLLIIPGAGHALQIAFPELLAEKILTHA